MILQGAFLPEYGCGLSQNEVQHRYQQKRVKTTPVKTFSGSVLKRHHTQQEDK